MHSRILRGDYEGIVGEERSSFNSQLNIEISYQKRSNPIHFYVLGSS